MKLFFLSNHYYMLLQCHTYLAMFESFGDIFRDGGTGEAAVLPNFKGLLNGNFNDFCKKSSRFGSVFRKFGRFEVRFQGAN